MLPAPLFTLIMMPLLGVVRMLVVVLCGVLMCLLKQEGYYMQNASIPSHSIPQAAMSHLSASGQIVLPNGAIAMVGICLPLSCLCL